MEDGKRKDYIASRSKNAPELRVMERLSLYKRRIHWILVNTKANR